MSCQYIQAIKDTYDGIISVKTMEVSQCLSVSIGLYPPPLSLCFSLWSWMELTRHAHNEILWCMLFANDIMLVEKTNRAINS